MEQDTPDLLDLLVQPAFAAEGQTITKVTPAAARLLIREGISLSQILKTGQEEYASFTQGSLYVTLDILGTEWGASVTHTSIGNVFLLDELSDCTGLQMLALAARELRSPLSDAMLAAQQAAGAVDDSLLDTVSRLNRKLYQVLRLVSNMSDAADISGAGQQQECRMDNLFREVFEKAAYYAAESGFQLTYKGLSEEVSSLANPQQLERAALNLISNAMKFSPKGSTIRCTLTRRGHFLHLQVVNQGNGIPEEILPTVFQRYLRQPSIEDSRYGIGLGLLLVRSTAANHQGAVLIDQPEPGTTRVTMTLSIRQGIRNLNCPLQIDYAGEWDHTLVELSDCLPPSSYLDV